ncbi:hypothetical protein ALC60_06535 [Trachymyrmex zeteki]|uniref:Uncharacterized protein n=1 Tax=Mycetomoellerius zeteki TaxID=64791 RepID=A0A151X2T6_9HYME|nr:hypothetical protein ALC60_06535 [Trachymyrmex zeteki]
MRDGERRKVKRNHRVAHNILVPSLFHVTERCPIKTSRYHTQRVKEWWGDYGTRRYLAHTETRRNQIDASALRRKGEKAVGLSVKENREDIMRSSKLKREERKWRQ